MNRNFIDGTVVITGASSGIGLAIAKLFASESRSLILVARDQLKLENEIQSIKNSVSASLDIEYRLCDLSVYDEVKQLASDLESMNDLSVLINCAGIANTQYLNEIDNDQLAELVGVNLTAPMVLSRAAVRSLSKSNDQGCIINVASMISLCPYHGYTAYAASKAGLIAFSDGLRREAKGKNIQVMTILPADVETPMLKAEQLTMPLETKILNGQVKPIDADVVAQSVLKGLRISAREVVPGKNAKVMRNLLRFIPRTVADLVIEKIVKGSTTNEYDKNSA